MKMLFIGDVVGKSGRRALRRFLPELQDETEELRKISQRYDEMNKTLGQTMGYTTEITEDQRQEFNRYAQQLVDNAICTYFVISCNCNGYY